MKKHSKKNKQNKPLTPIEYIFGWLYAIGFIYLIVSFPVFFTFIMIGTVIVVLFSEFWYGIKRDWKGEDND